MVKAIDGRTAAGVRLLTVVVEHAEASAMPSGRWLTEASEGRLMDVEGSVWFVVEDGLEVQRLRMLSCPCSCAELTVYQDGREISRTVGAAA
ncbi:hypothetical protein [Streptomyces albireticuli]|uniref:Uncharacterized protein n=1 Tax=Streptomyces albireticuli TaxID=1940 RepID=A0A2A2CZH1_9ACTN|nr:hypothetical protein [Streptomyces albireticuli]MCD9145787.1 hypothetical protein [Streptomyces albireticuli]MCD9165864.1 hypothetical protein [Streptomyces albireticuli]MCD9194457.1 hypothetical protein [Streptomyces albireticuli]PAU44559.1 hypothetical protein CK936_34305 [Streptomyces albireticuli]